MCAAVVRGDDSIVTMLLHWGANVNALGKKEQSPLVIAARAGVSRVRVAWKKRGLWRQSALPPPALFVCLS